MRIERCLELHVDILAVLSDEPEHIFIDQSEAMPSTGDFLQGFHRHHDLVGVHKLCDFDEGKASLMLLADGTDKINHPIRKSALEVYHMSHNLLELVAIVVAELI